MVFAGAIYLWFRKELPAAGDSRPDNPRFQTWNEAFNRAITDDLRFFIEYVNRDGEISGRVITPKSIHLMRGEKWLFIKAQCHLRNDERTFRSDRIQFARNLDQEGDQRSRCLPSLKILNAILSAALFATSFWRCP